MEEFDAPDAVRADYDTLRSAGAAQGRFQGVPAPQIELQEHTAGQRLRAALQVPHRAGTSYFDDHFPRRPVFPGTLLLDALAGLAVQVAREALPGPTAGALAPTRISNVKIRSFTAPGTALDLEIDLVELNRDRARLKLGARNDGKAIATARIEIGQPESAQP